MVTLRLFAVLAGFGAAVAMWRIYRASPAHGLQQQLVVALLTILGALVGARAGYVLTHPLYFSLHPDQAMQFWHGGLNAFGALAGAVLFTLLAAAVLRTRALPALDLASLMLLPMGTLIWLGLWYEGVAYGSPLAPGEPLAILTPDETGALSTRFPLQFSAAISLLFLLCLIERVSQNNRPGFRFALAGLGFSTHTLIFSMLRADAVFPVRGIRSDAFFSLLFAAAFALMLVLFLLPSPGKKDKMEREEKV